MFANKGKKPSLFSCKGFTLLEVLIVVLIAVMVTMFAVPAYRKAQDRNRYLAAVGVLMEMASAAQILHEEFPTTTYSATVTANATWSSCPQTPMPSTVLAYLQCHKYLGDIPFNNGTYQGYTFNLSSVATANCGSSCGIPSGAWACMSGSNLISEYGCAWVDRSGILHNSAKK